MSWMFMKMSDASWCKIYQPCSHNCIIGSTIRLIPLAILMASTARNPGPNTTPSTVQLTLCKWAVTLLHLGRFF